MSISSSQPPNVQIPRRSLLTLQVSLQFFDVKVGIDVHSTTSTVKLVIACSIVQLNGLAQIQNLMISNLGDISCSTRARYGRITRGNTCLCSKDHGMGPLLLYLQISRVLVPLFLIPDSGFARSMFCYAMLSSYRVSGDQLW
jgi:hypothetical protein